MNADPVLQTYLANLATTSQGAASPSPIQMVGLMARLRKLEPRMFDIIAAIEHDNDPDFDRYFVSSHLAYLTDAQARLAELEAMPGPIYTVGLSVGGAVALALGAQNAQRVAKAVAFAPLLEVYGETRERYVNLAGPLDVKEFGWDDLRFPRRRTLRGLSLAIAPSKFWQHNTEAIPKIFDFWLGRRALRPYRGYLHLPEISWGYAHNLHKGPKDPGARGPKSPKHEDDSIRLSQYILVKICTLQYGRLRLLS